jgi:hypothetical protein
LQNHPTSPIAIAKPNHYNKYIKFPLHHWDDINNQRKFIESAAKQLNLKSINDWYNISHQQLCDVGGRVLLSKYNFSRSSLLSTLFPQQEWLPWKFSKPARNFWDDIKNQRKFMDWAGKTLLNVNEMSDWYKVTHKVTREDISS